MPFRPLHLVLALVGLAFATQAAEARIISWVDPQTQKVVTRDTDSPLYMKAYTPIVRKTVAYDGPYAPNTIIINTEERRLYLTLG